MSQKKVFVGMSGGVDSSLAAALLLEQGYDVTGVFMKNWTRDLPGFACGWEEDFKDAKAVAVQLGIPFMVFDFETDYRKQVVDYMLSAYQQGLTPNPDIMCNQEIKFKLFLNKATELGAERIATGHYARSVNGKLLMAKDKSKDQSYFLYRISKQALKCTLFPLGEMHKSEVRKQAAQRKLITAQKPDSQGICFVGEIGIKQFLLSELGEQSKGKIIDQRGKVIGEHDGAIYYTIGQRHGLNVGGGLPYYVIRKDMAKNEVYVSSELTDPKLWSSELGLVEPWWINGPPKTGSVYAVKCRYRSDATSCRLSIDQGEVTLKLDEAVRAASPGQSAVIYLNEQVIGGGIINRCN
jgi:tRNA-specific 2-thiouridylase